MNHIDVDGVDLDPLPDGAERRRLSDPLGVTGVAINRYRIPPGAGFPGGLHAHADQEEVFVVLAGEATFETLDGEVAVGAGEAVRFAPGEFQSGRNAGGDDLLALALGAPRESDDVRFPATCPGCGFGELRLDTGEDGGSTFVCPVCGAGRVPAPCPDCGGDDLRFTTDDEFRPAVECDACGSRFEEPPLRE